MFLLSFVMTAIHDSAFLVPMKDGELSLSRGMIENRLSKFFRGAWIAAPAVFLLTFRKAMAIGQYVILAVDCKTRIVLPSCKGCKAFLVAHGRLSIVTGPNTGSQQRESSLSRGLIENRLSKFFRGAWIASSAVFLLTFRRTMSIGQYVILAVDCKTSRAFYGE